MSFEHTPFIQREPTRQTSVNVTEQNWNDAKRNIIEFKDALAFGIKFLVAEKGQGDYPPNKLNKEWEEKMFKVQNKLAEVSQELWDLKEKYNPKEEIKKEEDPKPTKEEIEAEADKYLK